MVPIGARFAYDDGLYFVCFSFVLVPKSIHACAFAMGQRISFGTSVGAKPNRVNSSWVNKEIN